MLRPRAIAIASMLVVLATSVTRSASALDGPGCEAGASCADGDGDGFPSCTCAPVGTPCDCDDGDPAVYPRAPEACSSTRDNGCDGDAGGGCNAKEGCLDGLCVPECRPLDDFGCDNGSSCVRAPNGQALCMAPDCRAFGCPPGQTCDDAKTCVPNCTSEVRCPPGQLCRGFGCIDPCAGIECRPGAVCVRGSCVPSCGCEGASACPPGEACNAGAPVPTCIEASCVGVTCPGGAHCEHGACVDDCAGIVCPPERVCRIVALDAGPPHGACVDLCSPNPCKPYELCDWRDAGCSMPPLPEAGLVPVPDERASDVVLIAGAGLTCTTTHLVGGATATLFALAAFATMAALFIHRRRR